MFTNILRNTMEWSSLPSIPTGRQDCEAGFVTYPDGSSGIMVAGGNANSNEVSVEFLNLDTLIWEPKQSLPVDIAWGASVPYKDSFLIVGGKSDLYSYLDTISYYNPTLDEWELVGQMDYEREYVAAFMVPDSYANCV